MEQLNSWIKGALLGSAKSDMKQLRESLPPELLEVLPENDFESSEEEMISLLTLAIPYYKTGSGIPKFDLQATPAPTESKTYVPHKFAEILREILQNPHVFLVRMWMEKCIQANQLAVPDMLPTLLHFSNKNKEVLFHTQQVMGERGKWLAQQNDAWTDNSIDLAESWETGSLSIRKVTFSAFKEESLEKALTHLTQSWDELSASDRLYFFREIQSRLGEKHLPFLEKSSKDRSIQIKKAAHLKLSQTPGSDLYKQLKAIIQGSFKTESKGIWGFKTLHIKIEAKALPEDVAKRLNIERESLDKKFNDNEYGLYSILEYVPSNLLSEHLEISEKEILTQFIKDKELSKYLDNLIQGAIYSEANSWGEAYFQIMNDEKLAKKSLAKFAKDMVSILDHDAMMELFLASKLDWISETSISLLSRIQQPWNLKFSRRVLLRLKKEYMDSGMVYSLVAEMAALAEWMSVEIIPEMKNYLPSPDEKKETWRNAIAELFRNLALKKRITSINQ